ncbi:ABC-2 type transport system permease protein [Paenibacillus castaneae]|uniref:ABC transporter permease n=1 Tax=Paenibacillus castaneae TaxID=474957 RepID=UPI000C9A2E57|nr:ABC transporter permease [Paenibacillus castaneae]NIK75776.1 ABC-2 type transport system permease protein [Paenibacillus castaneae]
MASLHIALHLIRRTMGSRRGLIMNVLLPTIILSIMAGLFSNMQDKRAVILVSNADKGDLGSYLAASMTKESLYDVRLDPAFSEQALKAAVLNGEADAAVYISSDFTSALLAGEQSKAVLYRKNEQLWNASLATLLMTEANKLASTAELARSAGNGGEMDVRKLHALLDAQAIPKATAENVGMKLGKIVSNPMMIGLILMFVMLLVSQSIGFVMEDREHRTMARMFTAPLRAIDIALGNFIGSLLVGTLQLIIVLSMTFFVFGYSPGTSFGSMLLVLECFLFAAVGLASAAAGLVRNSAHLSNLNNIIITPSCLISGCFFPLSMLPDFIQKLANFTPQKWAIQAIDRLGADGTISDIKLQLLILLLFAAVLIAFGSAVLKPNQTH